MRLLFAIIPVALLLTLAAGHCVRTGVQLDDGGYIVLRVADNLRHGAGMVFNPGERRDLVDSPLWVGVLALAALSDEAPFVVLVLGLALGVVITLIVLAGPRLPVAGACASLFVALDGLFAAHVTAGTSTALAALYLVGLSLAMRGVRGSEARTRDVLVAIWLAAAPAVRTELVLVAWPAALVWAVTDARRGRAWLPLVGVTAIAAVCAAVRWRYFGTLPAYWQPWPPTGASIAAGGAALADLLVRRPLLVLGVLVLGSRMVARGFRPSRAGGLAFGLLLLAGFAVIPAGGQDVARYAAMALPLAYVLSVEAMWRGTRTRFGLVAALLLVAAQPAWTWSANGETTEANVAYARLGQWLRTRTQVDTVVGARQVGALGYFSGLRMEDVRGQVSGRVASHRPLRQALPGEPAARDFAPMLSLEPDLVIVGTGEPVPSAIVYVPNQDAIPPALRSTFGIYRWAGSPVWRDAAAEPLHEANAATR